MSDLTFLKALRDKLKGGNIRSIHLNALPGRFATRLDLGNLNYIKPAFAEEFLGKLLSKSCFEFPISFDGIDLNTMDLLAQKNLGLLSKRLNSINIENEDNYKEHGIKTFSFGYPLLIKHSKSDPKKIIKAPLFIWPLEIVKANNKINSWTILRNKIRNDKGKIVDQEIHSVGLNEVLISFLKNDEQIVIPQINEELLEDAVIDRDELLDECDKILLALNANSSPEIYQSLLQKLNGPVNNIPESKSLEEISGNKAWIHFGGVFGLFRTQKESIITDIDVLIDRFDQFQFDELKFEPFMGTIHSAVDTDPSQQEILATLGTDPKKIIQGPPGTGKSQSLTALITNALANNLKCLIVCEKKTALDVIKSNLIKTDPLIGALACVVEDINKDRDGIVNSVRDRLLRSENNEYFSNASYLSIREALELNSKAINTAHFDLDEELFRGNRWTTLVGAFLAVQKVADFSLLKNKLNYKDFKFLEDEKELPEFLTILTKAKGLYEQVKRLQHPLDILRNSVFDHDMIRAVQLNLEEQVEYGSRVIGTTQNSIRKQIDDYEIWLTEFYNKLDLEISNLANTLNVEISEYSKFIDEHFENYYHALKLAIKDYKDVNNLNLEKYGSLFYKNDRMTKAKINFLSLFSKKYTQLKEDRTGIIQGINNIMEAHQKTDYITHHYEQEVDVKSFLPFVANINTLEKESDNWYDNNKIERPILKRNFCVSEIHPTYKIHVENVARTEANFNAFEGYIAKDRGIKFPEISSSNHFDKLEVLNLLKQQLQNKKELLRFYLNNVESENLHFDYKMGRQLIRETEKTAENILKRFKDENIFKLTLNYGGGLQSKLDSLQQLSDTLLIISSNLAVFREYFEWRQFYQRITSLQQNVIIALIETEAKDWGISFSSWYYYWILSFAEARLKFLPKNDDLLIELSRLKAEFKITQIKSIVSNWTTSQGRSATEARRSGLNPTSLYNKRGGAGERRNSLRKIIRSDFKLFTDFFPALMVSPSVCSSILPLTEGLFDIVIFDEASQLRLEDTYPALLRGKIKVISGDSQQMPPSNFFQGGSAILNPTEEEYEEDTSEVELASQRNRDSNSLVLADSESLLMYAENSNYKQSYLKIHYRSQHPYLIDFSNHAFYGKRLIPMPAKYHYKPIQFIQVNGVYEDQVNRDEAMQVIDILLNHIKPFKNGKYPSVGIATFNLYQRNLILEQITKVRQQSLESDKKIGDLGNDLFVKNLENIQGDERDIIIITTTFGRKADGTFRQQFGPIIQGNGFKLLNVIITRAKYKVFLCTSIPGEKIEEYSSLLQSGKNNGRAVFYAYLAYARAVSSGNDEVREAILAQLFDNCDSRDFELSQSSMGSESPFEDEVYYRLASKVGEDRLEQQHTIGGFRIDLIVRSKQTGKPLIAIECDGAKYHSSNEAFAWDMFRQSQLEQYGFIFKRVWSTNWWISEERELKILVDFISEVDAHEMASSNIFEEESITDNITIAVKEINQNRKKVTLDSLVTVKNPDGKIIKIRFTPIQNAQANKPDQNGITHIFNKTALAIAIIGKHEGDVCQLGLLEIFYEILKAD